MSIFRYALFVCAALANAQSFEVASLKFHPGPINFSADPAIRGRRVTGTASTLLDLITAAYGVRYDQLGGAPAWAGNDHYDLIAKAPDGEAALTRGELQQMLRALLAERFRLTLREEIKDVPAYALVVGKSGPKFHESAPDAPGSSVRGMPSGAMHMDANRCTMDYLASQLAGTSGRPVIDRTGLTGIYQFTLDWLPPNRAATPDSDVADMVTAVQQLGLKLESIRAPYRMLVIEHAEKPTEN